MIFTWLKNKLFSIFPHKEKKPEVNSDIQELYRELRTQREYITTLEKQQKMYAPMIDMYKNSKNEDWYKLFKEELEKSTSEIKRLEKVNARLTEEAEAYHERQVILVGRCNKLEELTREQVNELAAKTEAIKQQLKSLREADELTREQQARLQEVEDKSIVIPPSNQQIKRLEKANRRLVKEVEDRLGSEEELYEKCLVLEKLTQEQKSELEAIKQQQMSLHKSDGLIEELEARLKEVKEKSIVIHTPPPSNEIIEARVKLEVENRTSKLEREKEANLQAYNEMKLEYDREQESRAQGAKVYENTIHRLNEQLEGQKRLITASLSESNQLKELNKEKHRLEDEVSTYAEGIQEAQAIIPHMISRIRWLEKVIDIQHRDMDESDLRKDFYTQNELMFQLIGSVTKLVDNYPTNRSNLLQLTSQTLHTLKELNDKQVEKTSYDNQVTLKQVELDQMKAEELSNSVMYELRQLHDSLELLESELNQMSGYIKGEDKAILHTLKRYESVRDIMMYRDVTEEPERVRKQLKFRALNNAFMNFEKEVPRNPPDLYSHHKGEAISSKVDRLARGNLRGIPDEAAKNNSKTQLKPVDLPKGNPKDTPITNKPVSSGLIQAHTRSHDVQIKSFQKLFNPFAVDVKAYNHIQGIRGGKGVNPKSPTNLVEDSL